MSIGEQERAQQELERVTKQRAEYISGLRELADFLEKHQDVPLPSGYLYCDTDRDGTVAWAKAYPKVRKNFYGNYLTLSGIAFGPLDIGVSTSREQVCRKIVLGTEHVEERVIPAHDKEVVDWVCEEPLLAPAKGVDHVSS